MRHHNVCASKSLNLTQGTWQTASPLLYAFKKALQFPKARRRRVSLSIVSLSLAGLLAGITYTTMTEPPVKAIKVRSLTSALTSALVSAVDTSRLGDTMTIGLIDNSSQSFSGEVAPYSSMHHQLNEMDKLFDGFQTMVKTLSQADVPGDNSTKQLEHSTNAVE